MKNIITPRPYPLAEMRECILNAFPTDRGNPFVPITSAEAFDLRDERLDAMNATYGVMATTMTITGYFRGGEC